jgi:peroxiredoxin
MAARGQHRLLEPGRLAPEFRLERLGGGSSALKEILAGGPALLAFFKVSCPVCQMTFPFLERIHAAGAMRIFGISQNDAPDTREFNQEFGVTFPTLLDSEDNGFPASNDYGISSVPTLFLLEPGGKIANVIEGWRKREMESLAAPALASLFRPGDYVPEWKAG